MTVQDLINRLKILPPGATVLVSVFSDQGDRTGEAYDVTPIPPTEKGENFFCEIAARPYECRRKD